MSVIAPAEGTTFATTTISGAEVPQNLIVDTAGADPIGLVTATPGAQTILGRLKAIVDAVGVLYPATAHFAITPSDVTNFATAARSIYVGGAGDVVVVCGGTAVTYKAVPVGTTLNVQATRVNSTSTTATFLVGLV